jgi:hypothetical protein
VVVRPFAVDGGHEKIRKERVYGQPPRVFAQGYNGTAVTVGRHRMYRQPSDARGEAAFLRLVDMDAPSCVGRPE